MKASHIALAIGALVLFSWVLATGWSKNEVVECQQWLAQSKQANWYSTNWQREQCHAHGVTLPEGT